MEYYSLVGPAWPIMAHFIYWALHTGAYCTSKLPMNVFNDFHQFDQVQAYMDGIIIYAIHL